MEICFWNDSFKGSYGCLVNLVSKGRLGISLGIRRCRYYLGMDTFGMVMVPNFYSPRSRNFWSQILYLWKCIPTPFVEGNGRYLLLRPYNYFAPPVKDEESEQYNAKGHDLVVFFKSLKFPTCLVSGAGG